ncbi:LOW QUALITY PROTEIN: hypothetical protein ACHAXR_007491 [Thalassiosira sp. AJA248-18]
MKVHPESSGAAAMCSSLHAFFGKGDGRGNMLKELGMKNITNKYTVIHARSLEEFGDSFMKKAHELFGVDIRRVSRRPNKLDHHSLVGMNSSSILLVTDTKNSRVVDQLSSDAAIGPIFQEVPPKHWTGDMMLAILSDVFVGNPVSTFSQYVVQARYALGIKNSYLFARRDGDEWETFCNVKKNAFITSYQ